MRRVAPRLRALPDEGGSGGVGDDVGAPCWAPLLPGLGCLGPDVVEDFFGGSVSRCLRGSGLWLEFVFRCGLRLWCADGLGWLLDGGLGFRPGCGRVLHWGVGLGCSRAAIFEAFPVAWGVEYSTRTWWR